MSSNNCRLRLSPEKVCDDKYKKKIMAEIMQHLCGLLNTGGGTLALHFENACTAEEVDKFFKMIEQKVRNVTSTFTVSGMSVKKSQHQLVMTVSGSFQLVTLNYHLYLPDEYEIVSVPPAEPNENIKKIVQGRTGFSNATSPKSYHKSFTKGHNVGFTCSESRNVQLKLVKAEPSTHFTLAKRICGNKNKLCDYVSGFANHSGGHIYYGVDKNGIVCGEKISEDDKVDIVKKVDKALSNMTWPGNVGEAKRGRQWNIYFEPVTDAENRVIQSLYVIVIFVAQCPGGVFVQEPESYHFVNGKLKKMSFSEWMSHFKEHSSQSSRLLSQDDLTEALVDHIQLFMRNNLPSDSSSDCMVCKKSLNSQDVQEVHNIADQFADLYKKITTAHKKRDFQEAEELMQEMESFCRDPGLKSDVFEVMALYQRSCVHSAKGEYKKSHQHCQVGLEKMQSLKAQFITVQLYLHAAMLAMILICKSGEDLDAQAQNVRSTAQEHLQLAMRDVKSLKEAQGSEDAQLLDLDRKLNIYMACVHLGCCLTGEALDEKHLGPKDITEAKKKLKAVCYSASEDKPLSPFRECQLRLVECDLVCRKLQQNQYCCNNRPQHDLEKAFKSVEQAQSLAEEHNFLQIAKYAEKRFIHLKELSSSMAMTG